MASYDTAIRAPLADMRQATRTLIKTKNRLYDMMVKAHELAAKELVFVHRKHLSGYYAGMGTMCFYAKPDSTPIHGPERTTKGVWRDIQKFMLLFDEPFQDAFDCSYRPIRITTVEEAPFLKIQRDW